MAEIVGSLYDPDHHVQIEEHFSRSSVLKLVARVQLHKLRHVISPSEVGSRLGGGAEGRVLAMTCRQNLTEGPEMGFCRLLSLCHPG